MNAYLYKGLLFNDHDLSTIVSNHNEDIFNLSLDPVMRDSLISVDKIYIDGDFNKYDLITVQLGSLSNGLEPEDIDCFSHFEIDVTINENEDPILEIKDRNYKLENLSMELQARILKVANEMYNDKMKTILND